jgi:hypothetical protein
LRGSPGEFALPSPQEIVMRNWFDEFAKAAGKGMSRRDAVRRMGAGLLGAFATAAGATRASAASVYTQGCKLKCAGRAEPAFTTCVNACVSCAEGGNIVCTASNGGVVCCPGSYRTCKSAAAKGAVCSTAF